MNNQAELLPAPLFMDLDRTGPVPLYYQVAQRIERAIREGELPPGSRLENEVTLGERLSLSRPTVRRAIQELVDKGMLVRRRGIGTQVVHGQVTRRVELTSLFDDLSQESRHPVTTVLLNEVIPASKHIAMMLSIEKAMPVLHLRRVRLADDVPLAVMENYLPSTLIDIESESLVSFGLYQLLRSQGTTIRVAKQRIGARRASADEGALLEIGEGSPVLTMDRTAYDASGRAVEYGHHCYRPDLYSFETTLVEK